MVAVPDDDLTRFSDDEPEWFDELEDMIASGEQETIVYPPAAIGWEITSERQAETVMRRLRRLAKRRREAVQQAAAWREPIDEWEADQLKRLDPGIAFYMEQLRAFGVRHREEFPKEATIRLPSGEIATKRGKAPVALVVDEAALIEWCETTLDGNTYEAVVKTERSVRVREFRALVRVVEVETPWCQDCGCQLFEVAPIDARRSRWRHLDGEESDLDCGEPHPVMGWAVHFVDDEHEVEHPVVGADVELPKVTATPKPRL